MNARAKLFVSLIFPTVPFRLFHRIGGASPKTLPSFNHDAPEEVCSDCKRFDTPLQKWGLKQIVDVDSIRALTLFSLIQSSHLWLPLDGVAYIFIYILECKIFQMK